jgi:tRNA dimethylallyltransferase
MVRRLNIGTAKPTGDELDAARHHLIDIVDPDETLTLAEVQALAYAAVDEILGRGHLPILSGGTGQYYRALVEGWVIPQVTPDPVLRARLQALADREGHQALHDQLAATDPAAAAKIDPRNVRRVIRALEVYEHTGEVISGIQERRAPQFRVVTIGLSRSRRALYERIDRRIDAMIDRGLEAEVRGLVEDGYGFDLPAMSSVGYAEWSEYFDGNIDVGEVVSLIRRNTRRLVRQQATWFREDDPRIAWFDAAAEPYAQIATAIDRFLAL